ncbi:hypothetical protein ILYODFUR_033724 [Ilyodon furcidens]|uniref:Uncharacterized protein n=1 Tax=Ilyodon furcidens TaxID=33524 RepID=A0ABV0UL82_9TELE
MYDIDRRVSSAGHGTFNVKSVCSTDIKSSTAFIIIEVSPYETQVQGVQKLHPEVINHFGHGGSISPVSRPRSGNRSRKGEHLAFNILFNGLSLIRCQTFPNLFIAPPQPKMKLDQTIPLHPVVVLFLPMFQKVRCIGRL